MFTGLLSIADALRAIGNGTDVYLFLAGMMLLAEIARRENVFAWLASVAVAASGGSQKRLFTLVYGVGIVVTAVLSNDATAVVLTPAVAASVRAAKAQPLPYLFACALVANAASFIFPISNPANLIVFARTMPPLGTWLATFALPSLLALAITYAVLRLFFRRELANRVSWIAETAALGTSGRVTLIGIGCTAIALIVASSRGAELGAVTLTAGIIVFGIVAGIDRKVVRPVLRSISWSVIGLVAGLFILVSAAERTGLLHATGSLAHAVAALPMPLALAGAGFITGMGSNFINNLPAGLIAGTTVSAQHAPIAFRSAVAVGIDLGPNLSVTGSLATILWLVALRREKIDITAWHFLRVGMAAMPFALFVAVESLLITAR